MTTERNSSPLKPRLKIFFSADIVGSTAYKQTFIMDADDRRATEQSVRSRSEWHEVITTFYRSISQKFPGIWSEKARVFCPDPNAEPEIWNLVAGERPVPWKTVGDEVIFWKELGHECQLWILLCAWLECIADQREQLRKYSLDVKSSIWTAEFPVRNSAILLRTNAKETVEAAAETDVPDPAGLRSGGRADKAEDKDPIYAAGLRNYYEHPYRSPDKVDFIGPGIDVGFRIAAFSSLKRMVMSVDAAYLFAVSHHLIDSLDRGIGQHDLPPGLSMPSAVENNRSVLFKLKADLKIPEGFKLSTRQGSKHVTSFSEICIHFSGSQELKGVLGGIKYPIFWINTVPADSLEAAKDNLYLIRGERHALSWTNLFDFCIKFYENRKKYITPPMILGSPIEDTEGNKNWSATWNERTYEAYKMGYAVVRAA